MPKHHDRKFLRMVLELRKDGFDVIRSNNKFLVKKGDGPCYKTHSGLRSYHPVRRFLKSNYDYIF